MSPRILNRGGMRKRIPEGAKFVARPSRWGNPFKMDAETDRATAVARYREWAETRAALDPEWLDPLRGRDLVCYCWPTRPCHAEVLLMLANDLSYSDVDDIYARCYPREGES